jgi:asparagine synthase (glutamine-hydrolysing)
MSQLTHKPIKTFSIGFKGGGYHDETRYADIVAKRYRTAHTVLEVDANMLLEFLPHYVFHFDEPFADYAAFPTFVLSKLAKNHVSVVLTGDGGDEIFAGYRRYCSEALAAFYCRIPKGLRKIIFGNLLRLGAGVAPLDSRLHRWFELALKKTRLMGIDPIKRYIHGFYKFHPHEKQALLTEISKYRLDDTDLLFAGYLDNRRQYDELSKRLFLDQMTSLPDDMLTKIDRATMAVSLEARVPFLDHRLVEFAATIPSNLKMTPFTPKRFVKRSMIKRLPRKIINRSKHGFSSPIDQWLRYDLKELMRDILAEDTIKRQGIFNFRYIETLMHQHMAARANHGEKLFMLMVFQMWAQRYLQVPFQ